MLSVYGKKTPLFSYFLQGIVQLLSHLLFLLCFLMLNTHKNASLSPQNSLHILLVKQTEATLTSGHLRSLKDFFKVSIWCILPRRVPSWLCSSWTRSRTSGSPCWSSPSRDATRLWVSSTCSRSNRMFWLYLQTVLGKKNDDAPTQASCWAEVTAKT